MVICVTGNSGVGKSYLASHLASALNFNYVSVDNVARGIYLNEKVVAEVENLLGISITENGKVNTKKIGAVIFDPANKNIKLEFYKLTMPYVEKVLDNLVHSNVVLDWSMLPLTKYWTNSSFKILVTASNRESISAKRYNVNVSYVKMRDLSAPKFESFSYNVVFNNTYDVTCVDSFINKVKQELNI